MNSDLISRSAFIQYINANVMGGSDWAKELRQDFIDMVNSQPTAYDTDKVVEQLGERAYITQNNASHFKTVVDLKQVEGIVKAGGKGE